MKDIYSRNLLQVIDTLGREIGVEYHKQILDGIKARDPRAARRAMREHLQETLRLYQETVK